MSAVEKQTVASGPAHIENEQDADLGGDHHLSAGGGMPNIVNTNGTQATNAVNNEVPKAKTPGGEEQAHEETGSDHADNSSPANNDSDTLTHGRNGKQRKGTDSNFDSGSDSDTDSDSEGDSDGDSSVDFFDRYQPRGGGIKGYASGKQPPDGSGLKSSKTKTPKGQSTAQPASQAQKQTKAGDKTGKSSKLAK